MKKFGVKDIHTEYYLNAGHGWVTDSFGHDCGNLNNPWINNCGFNMAFDMFEYFNDFVLLDSVKFDDNWFFSFKQPADVKGLDEYGYAYIPLYCEG